MRLQLEANKYKQILRTHNICGSKTSIGEDPVEPGANAVELKAALEPGATLPALQRLQEPCLAPGAYSAS